MIGLVGHTGVIGQLLQQFIHFDHMFDSKNIDTMNDYKFNILYCAAPSSNRLLANQNPEQDLSNITTLANYIVTAKANKVILISTVDTIVKTTPYAINRKFLEEQIQTLPDYKIIRLCSLIGPSIKKNLLYDLKHNQYIENINLHDCYQWYPLEYLPSDIELTITNSPQIVNLVSEPIENKTIIDQFAPTCTHLMQDRRENYYNLQPYRYSAKEIFTAMEKYFAN